MMGFLILNVCFDNTHSGFTYRAGIGIILPHEFTFGNIIFIDPKRRFAFYQLCNFGNTLFFPQGDQAVKVIGVAIHG